MLAIRDLIAWAEARARDGFEEVGIDDGGMVLHALPVNVGLCSLCTTLEACYAHDEYLEVGGIPLDEEE